MQIRYNFEKLELEDWSFMQEQPQAIPVKDYLLAFEKANPDFSQFKDQLGIEAFSVLYPSSRVSYNNLITNDEKTLVDPNMGKFFVVKSEDLAELKPDGMLEIRAYQANLNRICTLVIIPQETTSETNPERQQRRLELLFNGDHLYVLQSLKYKDCSYDAFS